MPCSSIDETEIRDGDDLVAKIEEGIKDAREGHVMSAGKCFDSLRRELGL